jgi:hypothetical protein
LIYFIFFQEVPDEKKPIWLLQFLCLHPDKSEDRGQIAEFGNFQTIRRWTFDAYSPPPEDSTFISFSFDLTGRSRPAAALNTDPPAVENHQLRITCCQKKSLSAYPIGTTRFKFESIAQENGGKLSKL